MVNAKGEVYAETWYYVTIGIPFKYEEKKETGRIINHYYVDFLGNNITLIGKYDSKNVDSKAELLLDKPYLPFNIYREIKKEYKYIEHSINEKEAYSLGVKRSEEEIMSRVSDGYIISKKVLKKEVKSSKMVLEVFYKVYENIGYTSNIDKKEEKERENGSSN